MANLVAITDPSTGLSYRVHPFIAEQGEWFAEDNAAFRAQLPGAATLERDMARALRSRLAAQPSVETVLPTGQREAARAVRSAYPVSATTQHPTPAAVPVLGKAGQNA